VWHNSTSPIYDIIYKDYLLYIWEVLELGQDRTSVGYLKEISIENFMFSEICLPGRFWMTKTIANCCGPVNWSFSFNNVLHLLFPESKFAAMPANSETLSTQGKMKTKV
jgi:hypothetical protein